MTGAATLARRHDPGMVPRSGAGDHPGTMNTSIQLLGRPRIRRGPADVYKFRSRKSWALLAYLILSERPAPRSQLASLLFADANDPVRALRWSLAEIRVPWATTGRSAAIRWF